jgi:hypothetical protein
VVASLWERIQALERFTLPTVSGRAAFDITSVDDGHVRITPYSSGQPRPIKRQEFEQAEALGLATADVTPIELRRAGVSEFNPAYVAAIIRAAVEQITPNHRFSSSWLREKPMRIFEDDDAGYLAWIDGHQHGFVLNTYRKPDPRRDGETARRRDGERARG